MISRNLIILRNFCLRSKKVFYFDNYDSDLLKKNVLILYDSFINQTHPKFSDLKNMILFYQMSLATQITKITMV